MESGRSPFGFPEVNVLMGVTDWGQLSVFDVNKDHALLNAAVPKELHNSLLFRPGCVESTALASSNDGRCVEEDWIVPLCREKVGSRARLPSVVTSDQTGAVRFFEVRLPLSPGSLKGYTSRTLSFQDWVLSYSQPLTFFLSISEKLFPLLFRSMFGCVPILV